jgi:cation:H+ antiporter
MLWPSLGLVAGGLVLLVLGGELLVRGAVRMALAHGVSTLVVGLTIVAFGTSAPELAVAVQAVRAGAGDLALGNALGSNIFNTLCILGLTSLVAPLLVSRRVVWIEVPLVVAISLLALGLSLDGELGVVDGVVLIATLGVYTWWLLRTARGEPEEPPDEAEGPAWLDRVPSWMLVLAGLGVLVLGARALVNGASTLAAMLGVGDDVIGLTVVAMGTSLPEVAASLVATARGHRDVAVGNVLGSNIFNLTLILGAAAIVGTGLEVPRGLLTFDFVVVVAAAAACLPVFYTGHRIARWEGLLFLAYYAVYVTYLVLDATGHAAASALGDAVLYFALPLTVITLIVVLGRAAWSGNRPPDAPAQGRS